MDAGENDLFCAALQCRLNVEYHICQRTAATRAARNGGDTKCTVIVAAILHFDKGPRATVKSGQGLADGRADRKLSACEGVRTFSALE